MAYRNDASDEFHTSVSVEALSRWPISHRPWAYRLGEKWRLGFIVGANWARQRMLRGTPQVTIVKRHNKPTTCEVRKNGVLIFSGRDYTEEINL